MSAAFETTRQPQPVCPYCKHVVRDVWDVDFGPSLEGETEVECGNELCEKPFLVERIVDVSFTTRAKP